MLDLFLVSEYCRIVQSISGIVLEAHGEAQTFFYTDYSTLYLSLSVIEFKKVTDTERLQEKHNCILIAKICCLANT